MANETSKKYPEPIDGTLRKFSLRVPDAIRACTGIRIFGKRIKSLVFSTDLAIIKNVNADAVIAVYPFTPQPVIAQSLIAASDIPVFAGVGGGLTSGKRSVHLAISAEASGALGVVLNAPVDNATIAETVSVIDIPVIVTVVSEQTDFEGRVAAGTSIFNVSAATKTPEVVKMIRDRYPDMSIIATGGPDDDSIRRTIEAGANAITWTPPTNGEIFKDIMARYRAGLPHP
ncbi:MAG: hydrolase [Eubacteriales bacterium]